MSTLIFVNKDADYTDNRVGSILLLPAAVKQDMLFLHLARKSEQFQAINFVDGSSKDLTPVGLTGTPSNPPTYGDHSITAYGGTVAWATPYEWPAGDFTMAAVFTPYLNASSSAGMGLISTRSVALNEGGFCWYALRTGSVRVDFTSIDEDEVMSNVANTPANSFAPVGSTHLMFCRVSRSEREIAIVCPRTEAKVTIPFPSDEELFIDPAAPIYFGNYYRTNSVPEPRERSMYALWDTGLSDSDIYEVHYPAMKAFMAERGVTVA